MMTLFFRWVIKARVTSKSPVRTWSNAKGEGKLFSMDLVDESGEIRVTAFKEQCDKFYDLIEVIHKCSYKYVDNPCKFLVSYQRSNHVYRPWRNVHLVVNTLF